MAEYNDNDEYEVTLTRTVSYRGHKLRPRDAHTIRGSMIKAIIEENGSDVIASLSAHSGE